MTPRGQESFKFEEEPLPPESVESNGLHLVEGEDECQYCGNTYESEGSCVHCRGDKRKLDYLKENKEKSSLTEFETEVERLKKIRPDLANNKEALAIKARINIDARKPSKLKPPEDPNYH